jgi:hypothetical protein
MTYATIINIRERLNSIYEIELKTEDDVYEDMIILIYEALIQDIEENRDRLRDILVALRH